MKRITIAIVLAAAFLTSCTQNEMAKNFGGSMTINLPANQKLVNVTWKDNEVWYLARPMKADETPETWTFQEKSSYGIQEGTITLVESKK